MKSKRELILKKKSNDIEKLCLGISVLIFLILTFGIGATNMFGLEQIILKETGYFFAVTIYFHDYALLSLIPFFGIKLNSRRFEFKYSYLIMDILTIFLWTILSFGMGLFILTFIGKPSNPLIPQYLITEPIYIYSVIFIGIGIGIPFLFKTKTQNQSELNDIGQ